MAKYLQIQVDKPCHEKWEQMQASATGNFCNSCQKTVIDFTAMTDNQLLEYFTKHPSGVCGRFYDDQLEQQILMPVKRIPWLKYFFGITLPAMLFSYKANAQRLIKKNREPVAMMDKKWYRPIPLTAPMMVSGRVTGKNGEAVPFASVMIAGTNEGIAADSSGSFALRLTGAVRFLEVSAVGYKQKLVSITGMHTDVQLDIALSENIVLSPVLITSYRRMTTGLMTTVTRTSMWTKEKKKTAAAAASIELFPNPVKRNGLLTIRWKKPVSNNQQIILYNASGVELIRKMINIEQPLLQTQLNLDLTAAGYHIINVIDTRTHKKQAAPLVIE